MIGMLTTCVVCEKTFDDGKEGVGDNLCSIKCWMKSLDKELKKVENRIKKLEDTVKD